MITVKKLVKTCFACPAQWEGETDDSRLVYIRYRWGYLSVRISPANPTSISDAVHGEEIFGEDFADSFGGYMENDELRDILVGVVNFQCMNNTEKSE